MGSSCDSQIAVATDAELMMQVQYGSQWALGELYSRHERTLTAVARRLVGVFWARDLVHDVFLGLWQRRQHQRDSTPIHVGDYLRSAVRYHALRWLRRSNLLATTREHAPVCAEPPTPPGALKVELEHDLCCLAKNLSPRHRLLLTLHLVHDLDSRQIAELHGRPVSTVKSDLRRAVLKLREVEEETPAQRFR